MVFNGCLRQVLLYIPGVTAIVAYKEIDVDLDTIAEGTVLIFTPVGGKYSVSNV